MLRRLILVIGAGLVFVALTALTQLGGVIFLASVALAWALRRAGLRRGLPGLAGIVFFLAGLPLANLFVAPALAALQGRVALP